MTRLTKCPDCEGKGFIPERSPERIGKGVHCRNVRVWCGKCRRSGKVFPWQLKEKGNDGA